MKRRSAHERGLTLLEVMISVAVLTLISVLIYGAFSTINRGKQTASQLSERYRIGRVAMDRMARELQSAYISAHVAALPQLITRTTAFLGKSGRVDFNAFAHRRLMKDAHESDQCELSYFVGSSKKQSNQSDLLRREQAIPDDQPGKGGVVNVMVDDIDTFQVKYLDPMSGLWTDTWDSTSTAGQLGRLPLQVEIYLAIKGGPAGDLIRLRTKTQLSMLQPLSFALK
ncbi:MAG: type II secretion system protein GspJ [Polyangiales bacterium]